jgi:uncharacterized repeat protein (TIGR03803 family)
MTKLLRFPLCLASMFALALLAPGQLEAGGAKVSYKVLYSFLGQPDGAFPTGLIRDANGTLYGITEFGGTGTCSNNNFPGCGTVFTVGPSGKETVLHSFAGYPTDGAFPNATLVQDSSGNLYGTTQGGGAYQVGTVFKVDASGTETVLYSFCPTKFPCTDGSYPLGALILDANGSLYGTTHGGGSANYGTVFKVDQNGTETVLYSFTDSTDGAYPQAGLIFDAAGNLYGTASLGGAGCNGQGCGVVFKLDTTGKETVLYSFKNFPDGAYPEGGLIWDGKGNLYGTTSAGGIDHRYCNGCGTIFKVSPSGKETVLYRFPRLSTGDGPRGTVVRDSAGNLYGTAGGGGNGCGGTGCGVVFKLSKTGKLSLLYKASVGAGGIRPSATLVRDASGALYGTMRGSGAPQCPIPGCGTVFKLTP